MDNEINVAEINFNYIVDLTKQWEQNEFRRLTWYFIIIALVLVGGSVYISTYISKKITRPLTELTNHITRFVDSKFTLESEHPMVRTEDEIGKLTRNFSFFEG